MAYRNDADLEFLAEIKSEDLNDLVYCLTYDKDGEKRITEELTESSAYKTYNPDHHQYWELIAAEIQCFGANSFATLFRGGKGVLYKEVLTDVCDKLKVNYNYNSTVEKIETHLLMKILEDSIDKLSPDELQILARDLGMKNFSGITPQALTGIFQTVFQLGGFKSYQYTLIIANYIMKAILGRGLSLAGNAVLTRTMSVLAGPIGWAITGLWTAFDIAGPAYRVTIPAVIQVAVLRQKYLYDDQAKEVSFG